MIEIDVDFNLLEARLADLQPVGLRPLVGGASSLSYVATGTVDGAARRMVVKVAPPGLAPVRNRDVLRQAALLRRLATTDVPVPAVLWEDAGDPPEVPPIFVMSFVEGTSLEPLFDDDPDAAGDEATVVAERMRDAVRVLASLHAVEPAAIGLGAEPVVSLGAEVARWSRALGTVDPALAPGWEKVADSLAATAPPAMEPAIIHGDYRLGNMLATGPSVTAVIDWEIWSVGDPRVDLGWFLINADPAIYRRPSRYAGVLPTPEELAAAYADRLGAPVAALDWFRALACFKSTATWSLIIKHARRRPTPDRTAEEMAGTLGGLVARAAELVG
ncbi:phosphotransferase family protein [Frankia sp. AgB1.8]|uniref:phosphotransferase family protein n=1 Tax=unclassified Frankia TaxID=2632575 RepID=UPI0035A91971